jgi:peptidoglycan hydrolase-like protein with peptidoglycan-binding domain
MPARQSQAIAKTSLALPAAPSRSMPGHRPASSLRMGNQAIQQRLIERTVQAKLTVNQPGDRYEQEADHVAEQVMRRPETEAHTPIAQSSGLQIQRRCPACEDKLHRKESAQPQTSLAGVALPHGSGQPLSPSARRFFEPRFGRDFGQVRIHTGSQADASARSVNSLAYTAGADIVFARGQYAPETGQGKKLLAHELTHTVQQSSEGATGIQRTIGDGHDLASPRFAGAPVLEAVFDDERLLRSGDSGPAVATVQQALVDAGFPLPAFGVDGVFGAETRTAVERYQAGHGLVADGIVGPITMGSLDAQFPPLGAPPAAPVAPQPVPPVQPAAAPLGITALTVVNQATAITYPEPGAGGPHFVSVAGRTGDEHMIVEASTNRALNPGEMINWTFDPAAGGAVDAGNPARALVSRRRATRVRVTATHGASSRSLTLWAIFARVRTVSGPTITFSPPAPPRPGCGAPGTLCVNAPVNFDAEIFPRSLVTSVDRPSFARAPVAPPGATNACGLALAGGINGRFDMSRQINRAMVDPAGLRAGCMFVAVPFPTNNAEGNDDTNVADEKNDPFAAGVIATTGRAVAAGFLGSFDRPSFIMRHTMGVAGDTIERRVRFREFARLEYHNTWFSISNVQPWFATFRLQKNAAGLWVDNGSVAG